MPNPPYACEPYEEELSALIDGELSSQREAQVRDHLSVCAGCSRSLEALRGVDHALAEIAMPEVPAGLRLRVQAEIQDIPQPEEATRKREVTPRRTAPSRARGRFYRPAAGVALAAAASVVIYLAVVPEPTSDAGFKTPVAAVVDGASELEAASEEELAVLLLLDTIQDLDVIANLEMLERLMVVGEGTG
jgi:anti-sigma factor RsiW